MGFSPPVLLPYRGQDPPPGYEVKYRLNAALLGGGGLVLGITYVTSIAYGSSSKFENGLEGLAVPVLGPWLAIGKRDFTCEVDTTQLSGIESTTEETQACVASQTKTAALLVGLGIGQLVGASLVTVGLLDRRKTWVRTDLAGMTVQFDVAPHPESPLFLARGTF